MPGAHVDDGEVRIIRRLRYVHGYTIAQTADLVGRGIGLIARIAPGRVGKVANDRLREAFLQSGVSASEVARRIGWGYDRGKHSWAPDSSRVRRVLGILEDSADDHHGGRRPYTRRTIDADMAVKIANAIGVPPNDVGAR